MQLLLLKYMNVFGSLFLETEQGNTHLSFLTETEGDLSENVAQPNV